MLPVSSFSQTIAGMSFNYNEALKDFKHNIQSSPLGISFYGLNNLGESGFSIGGELGVSMFANEDYTQDLTDMGYPGAMVDVYEEDCYLSYYAVSRYQLSDETMFVPYIEGKIGGISFFNDKVYDTPYGPNAPDKLKDKSKFLGTSFQYGFGGGVYLQLSHIFTGMGDQLLVDFGFTMMNGSKTNYRSVNYTEEVVKKSNDVEYLSKTNNIAYHLGVAFKL
jgi:hypothetical protein